MYSSAVLAVALASAASSALAAPVAPFHSFVPVNKTPLRILQARQSEDASGALKFNSGLVKDVVDIGNGIVSGIDGIKNLFSREELELLARAQETDASGALNFNLVKDVVDIGNGIINGADGIKHLFTGNKREEFEALVARQLANNEESGAIKINTGLIGDVVSIGNGIIQGAQGIKDFFTGNNKRDFDELLTRQIQDDVNSGALGLGTLVKVGGALVNGLSSLFGGNNKRDFDELHFAREYLDIMARQTPEESGALGISTLIKVGGALVNGISGLFNNKRDFDEALLTRELIDIVARELPADESGALGISTLVKVGGALFNGISSLFGNNKRDDVAELLVRSVFAGDLVGRDVAAASTDSQAFDLGSILKTVAGFILKREEMELMARDAASATDSQAFDLGSILKTVAGFILKREEMELLARDATTSTDSQAFDLGSILKTVAGFILKREEEMMARSLNELD